MIEFRAVSKKFPDGTVAVEAFSLLIPSRQFTVFVGPSGCGKTTLLRMINRMVEPSTGQVLIDGNDVATGDAVKLRRSASQLKIAPYLIGIDGAGGIGSITSCWERDLF